MPEPLAGWIGGGDLLDLFVHCNDLLLQILPLAPEQADEVTHAWRKVRVCVLEDLGHRLLQLEGSLGEDHATLTNGFTNWAGINFTSWPCSRRTRPRKCDPEHASIPIKQVCMFAVKAISCFWVNFFFNSTLPLSPSATR